MERQVTVKLVVEDKHDPPLEMPDLIEWVCLQLGVLSDESAAVMAANPGKVAVVRVRAAISPHEYVSESKRHAGDCVVCRTDRDTCIASYGTRVRGN